MDDWETVKSLPLYDWYHLYYNRCLKRSIHPMDFDEWYKKIGIHIRNRVLNSSPYSFVEIPFTDSFEDGDIENEH